MAEKGKRKSKGVSKGSGQRGNSPGSDPALRLFSNSIANQAVKGDPTKVRQVLKRKGFKQDVPDAILQSKPSGAPTRTGVASQAFGGMTVNRMADAIRGKSSRGQAARRAAQTRKSRGGGTGKK